MAAVGGGGDNDPFFWKMPILAEDDLPDPAEEAAALAKKELSPPRSPPPVVWPPICPGELECPALPAGLPPPPPPGKPSGGGRGGRRKVGAGRGGDKQGNGGSSGSMQKREDRGRRQREKEAVAGDENQTLGRRGRGQAGGRDTWQDVMMTLPKRPDPVEETPEVRALRDAEEVRLRCRDQLRAATTPAELGTAVAAARELGLTEEVRIGERKLAKMELDASGAASVLVAATVEAPGVA